jgi:predicted peroxiredoxin
VAAARRIALLISHDVPWALQLAVGWAGAGDAVTAVLLDAAAAAARAGHVDAPALAAALEAGVGLAAEEGALRRRGIASDALADGVKVLDLDEIADLLVDGSSKAVWL